MRTVLKIRPWACFQVINLRVNFRLTRVNVCVFALECGLGADDDTAFL